MKKTLAAVLAAMMALSTATVAFAKDTKVDGTVGTGGLASVGDDTAATQVEMGTKKQFILTINGNQGNLGAALKAGDVRIELSVTEGRKALTSAPVVKLYKDKETDVHYAVIEFTVKHTYGIQSYQEKNPVKVAMKARVTAIDDTTYTQALGLTKKGDTLTTGEMKFESGYTYIEEFEDMTLTEALEVSDNNVLVDASELETVLDGDAANFYFDDVAAYSVKMSPTQKDQNLYFNTKIDADIIDAYPEVDFEFINFLGKPSFVRSGVLTFNAIGDKNTVVYEVTDDGLVELESDYDSTYDIVTVEGVKKLTSYVVASEALEVEDDAAAETPAVEESNPATGAC